MKTTTLAAVAISAISCLPANAEPRMQSGAANLHVGDIISYRLDGPTVQSPVRNRLPFLCYDIENTIQAVRLHRQADTSVYSFEYARSVVEAFVLAHHRDFVPHEPDFWSNTCGAVYPDTKYVVRETSDRSSGGQLVCIEMLHTFNVGPQPGVPEQSDRSERNCHWAAFFINSPLSKKNFLYDGFKGMDADELRRSK